MGGGLSRGVPGAGINKIDSRVLVISMNGIKGASPMAREEWWGITFQSRMKWKVKRNCIFPGDCEFVPMIVSETLTEMTPIHVHSFGEFGWLDFSQTRIKRIESKFCYNFSRLRMVLVPLTLERIDDRCFYETSLERLDLSRTAVEFIGDWFCAGCEKLREVLVPPTLKMIGEGFLLGSSVACMDLSRTSVKRLDRWFCSGWKNAREVHLPRTLVCLDSLAWPNAPLALVILPIASAVGIGAVYSASVMSGVVEFGSILARPMWPAQ
jgi:hypothetical protein